MEFRIPKTRETVKTATRPVIITQCAAGTAQSLFRRFICHYLEFLDQALMEEVARVHFSDVENNPHGQALEAFYRLRTAYAVQKKASALDFLDRAQTMALKGVDVGEMAGKLPFTCALPEKNENLAVVRDR